LVAKSALKLYLWVLKTQGLKSAEWR